MTIAVPDTWVGSIPEYLVYKALLKLGMRDGEDFIYQAPQMGGRLERGGAVLDFYFPALHLAINVQSVWFHYRNTEQRTADAMRRAQLESQGIRVVYIQEAEALRNAIYYVQRAISG